MRFTAYEILIGIALLLTIIQLCRPTWPLLPVAVLLVCVYLLARLVGG